MSVRTDPLSVFGLRPVRLADRTVMEPYFSSLRAPLSDYTFSQLFTWRNSLRIAWDVIDDHLCVFANGSGDLTLLIPPIGDSGGAGRALARCADIMDQYNSAHGCRDKSRVEYVSEELLARLDSANLAVAPQGTDYLYDVARMIDLAGGDLASKRQAKNRFARNYKHRVETYDHARHFSACLQLLDRWKERQDGAHAGDDTSSFIKRTKESLATQLTLEHAHDLGLKGIVVYVADEQGGQQGESIQGFTFGESLGPDQSSIVIEKTNLECKGLAQFIFSEFCRMTWADRPLVNAGDDWGIESLAWTKSSYRPVKLLKKFVVKPPVRPAVAIPVPHANGEERHPELAKTPPANDGAPSIARDPSVAARLPQDDGARHRETMIRPATREDLATVSTLERGCFATYTLSKRQLQYLQQSETAVFLVAEQEGRVVGEAIALIRRHKQSPSGRAYSLAVDPACRGQGIGQRLMRALLDELRRRGVRRVYLEVEAANAPAVHLYQRLGFRGIGALPGYYGDGKDGLHMMCEIAVPVAPLAA